MPRGCDVTWQQDEHTVAKPSQGTPGAGQHGRHRAQSRCHGCRHPCTGTVFGQWALCSAKNLGTRVLCFPARFSKTFRVCLVILGRGTASTVSAVGVGFNFFLFGTIVSPACTVRELGWHRPQWRMGDALTTIFFGDRRSMPCIVRYCTLHPALDEMIISGRSKRTQTETNPWPKGVQHSARGG